MIFARKKISQHTWAKILAYFCIKKGNNDQQNHVHRSAQKCITYEICPNVIPYLFTKNIRFKLKGDGNSGSDQKKQINDDLVDDWLVYDLYFKTLLTEEL